jgi:hypothetical protein
MSIVKNITDKIKGKKAAKNPTYAQNPVADVAPRRMAEMPVEVRPALVPVRFELSESTATRLKFLQDAQSTALANIEQNANVQITQVQNAANQAAAQVRLETRLRFSERLFDFLTTENIPFDAPLSIDGIHLIVMVSPEEVSDK